MRLSDNLTTILVAFITIAGGVAAEVARRRIKAGTPDDQLPPAPTAPAQIPPPPPIITAAESDLEEQLSMQPSGVDAALLTAINGTFDRLQNEINRYADESRRWREEARTAQVALDSANDLVESLRESQTRDRVTIERLTQQLSDARAEMNVIQRMLDSGEKNISGLASRISQARDEMHSTPPSSPAAPAAPPSPPSSPAPTETQP